jgi:hypothetical protein
MPVSPAGRNSENMGQSYGKRREDSNRRQKGKNKSEEVKGVVALRFY